MNYVILIVAILVGIYIGRYLFKSKSSPISATSDQTRQKEENKAKILEFLQNNERVTNNEVEDLLGVSNATTERYLDELEEEGKIKQVGTVGRNVYYILK